MQANPDWQAKLANPGPLGLLAFGMTTTLLNLKNASIIEAGPAMTMILGMGVFYGGITQMIVGILELFKNNGFGFVAFTSYGAFWLSFSWLKLYPIWSCHNIAATTIACSPAADNGAMAAYLLAWMVFTGVMFFGIPRSDRALQLVFGSLTMLFFLLGLSHLVALDDEDKGETVEKIAGWVGIVCGLSAIYAGFANLNGWPKTWEKPDKNEALLAAENKKDMEMVATH